MKTGNQNPVGANSYQVLTHLLEPLAIDKTKNIKKEIREYVNELVKLDFNSIYQVRKRLAVAPKNEDIVVLRIMEKIMKLGNQPKKGRNSYQVLTQLLESAKADKNERIKREIRNYVSELVKNDRRHSNAK